MSDVEEADHDIDLAARLEQSEQRRADQRAEHAAGDHDRRPSSGRRRRAACGPSRPETLAPVIWVVAEATATVGGIP